jgi:hypothetical protein
MQELGIPLQTAMQLVSQEVPYYQPGKEEPYMTPTEAAGTISQIWGAMCDKRMKENVIPIDGALDKVNRLSGNTYNYKHNKPETRDAGIMAQDLEAVLPEGVIEKDGIKYVKYDAVIALIVNAVNELHEEIRKVG